MRKPVFRLAPALLALSLAGLPGLASAQPDPSSDPKKAAKKYANLVKKDATNPDNWYNLALARCLLGEWSEAVPAAEKAVELVPESATFHFVLGKALKGAGRADEAVASYERSVELDPGLLGAQGELGDAYFDAGRFEAAVEAYKGALKTKPENPSGLYNGLGNAYLGIGQIDQATRWFERTLEAAPEDPTSWYNLGAIYRHLAIKNESFRAKAADAFKKAAELGPRDPNNLYQAGETALIAERADEARDFLTRFLAMESDTQRADLAQVLLDDLDRSAKK